MKTSTLVLLTTAIALTACGDDAGSDDTGASTGSPTGGTSSTAGSGSEGVDGGSTTDGEDTTDGTDPTDPTPILEREPMTTHACEETREMRPLMDAVNGRAEALVDLDGERFLLRSTTTLSLSTIALDGTLGDEVVVEPQEFFFSRPAAAAFDAGIAVVWTLGDTSMRYAVYDAALGAVTPSKELAGITGTTVGANALVAAPDGGVALIYSESDGSGQTNLRFVTLDAEGEATLAPVDVADLGPAYGWTSASAAATPDGGYAVSYTLLGEQYGAEVFFVILDADGTPRFEPQRISRAAGEGWSSDLGGMSRRNVLPVGDRFWVAFVESWYHEDPNQEQGHVVVKLAIVDGEGQSELHSLQAPENGRNNLGPSFVELEDRVGLLWTEGSVIWVCGGCISDNDLQFVLLDPEAVVPASNVVTQLHQMNGITSPIGAFAGSDMLTVSSLDFHALTMPASGAVSCAPAE